MSKKAKIPRQLNISSFPEINRDRVLKEQNPPSPPLPSNPQVPSELADGSKIVLIKGEGCMKKGRLVKTVPPSLTTTFQEVQNDHSFLFFLCGFYFSKLQYYVTYKTRRVKAASRMYFNFFKISITEFFHFHSVPSLGGTASP